MIFQEIFINFQLVKKLKWKFNFYKKRYKNIPIQLKLKISNNKLIVSDNLGYLYCLEIKREKLLGKKLWYPFYINYKDQDE